MKCEEDNANREQKEQNFYGPHLSDGLKMGLLSLKHNKLKLYMC